MARLRQAWRAALDAAVEYGRSLGVVVKVVFPEMTGAVSFFAREGRLLVDGRALELAVDASAAQIGAAVRRGLKSCRQVPDPPRRGGLTGPLTRLAGVRSWKAFAVPGTRSSGVTEWRGVVSVTPSRLAKGGVFAHLADLMTTFPGGLDDISDEDLGAAVLAALAVSVG
jgi:hypothetical protein